MAPLTRRNRILIGLNLLYAAAVIPIGINNGADFDTHRPHVEQLLAREPPYAQPAPVGLWWPPFALLALTPFALLARVSVALGKGAFAATGVACLAWIVTRFDHIRPTHLALALVAVAVPLETNFEWLNWNTVLLALIVAAGLDMPRNRDTRAGVWLGLATALKVFPGLLLVYAACRGRRRLAAVGVMVAAGASLVALLPLGATGALASAHDWLAQSATGGWVLVRRNQSLPALLGRAGWSEPWIIAVDVALVGLVALVLRRPASGDELLHDLGIVTLVAVLVTPIAWIHYYFLALPAWIGAIARAASRPPAVRGALVAAAVATSGLLTIWTYPSRVALQMHSAFAWGGLLLLAALVVEQPTRRGLAGAPAGA
jgi:alpha-1,2-mannosyltransferase